MSEMHSIAEQISDREELARLRAENARLKREIAELKSPYVAQARLMQNMPQNYDYERALMMQPYTGHVAVGISPIMGRLFA